MEDMQLKPIPFTQYLLPDGRKRQTEMFVPEALHSKAMKIIDAGYVFESEILTNGTVSLTIADPSIEEDVEIQLCENGPKVKEAIAALIESGCELPAKEG